MFFLGVLAVFQILFFPGLIFKALYHPKGKFFFQLSVVVTTSMLVNFLLFYAMILLHIYTRTSVLIVIGLEVIALLWLYRGMFRARLDDLGDKCKSVWVSLKENAAAWFSSENNTAAVRVLRGLVIAVFLMLSLSLVNWFFKRVSNGFGSVFNTWDAIVSWNAWAESWAQGIVPNVHLTYPQLLPINLSLTYILTGNYEVSFFAKAIMPIFALLTVLTILELAFSEKKYGYLIAVVLVYLLYKKFLSEYIADGYADIPVAFMALTALVPYLRREDVLADRKEFILSVILAAAAGLMKQVGLYILLLLPVAAFLNAKPRTKKLAWFCLAVLAGGVLLVLPWYLPRGLSVLQGQYQSGLDVYLTHSTQVQNTSSLLMRPVLAMMSLGKYAALYAFAAASIFLLKRRWRLLIIFFILPFTLLWGMVASYSVRNLSLTFPLLAVVTGLGLQVCLDWGWGILSRIKVGRISAAFLLLVLAAPIIYFGLKLDDEKIIADWQAAQWQIFHPGINEQLAALDFSQEGCQSILTNYPVNYLPGMQGRQINFYFDDFDVYTQYAADPSVCWMLVPLTSADDAVLDDIDAKLADGTYTLLYDTNNWVPYELIKVR
jgi:hypothetical protein